MGEYADDAIDAGIDEMLGEYADDDLDTLKRSRRRKLTPRQMDAISDRLDRVAAEAGWLDPDGPEDGRFWR